MNAARFRWVILALFFIVVAVPIIGLVRDAVMPPRPDNIPWHDDFAEATTAATAARRPMLVYFTASWCPPCKAMKRSTWPDARVGNLVRERFVPVLLDVDVEKNQPLGQRFGVSSIPAIFVLEPDGRFRDVAFNMTADEMVAFLERQAPAAPTTRP